MALRDKIKERTAPHLPAGETYKVGFLAQGGPSPYWALVTTLVVLFAAKYRVVVVTDKQVHVFKQSIWKAGQPKGLIACLPAGTRLSATDANIWQQMQLGGERLWVHRRFKADVVQANAASQAAVA